MSERWFRQIVRWERDGAVSFVSPPLYEENFVILNYMGKGKKSSSQHYASKANATVTRHHLCQCCCWLLPTLNSAMACCCYCSVKLHLKRMSSTINMLSTAASLYLCANVRGLFRVRRWFLIPHRLPTSDYLHVCNAHRAQIYLYFPHLQSLLRWTLCFAVIKRISFYFYFFVFDCKTRPFACESCDGALLAVAFLVFEFLLCFIRLLSSTCMAEGETQSVSCVEWKNKKKKRKIIAFSCCALEVHVTQLVDWKGIGTTSTNVCLWCTSIKEEKNSIVLKMRKLPISNARIWECHLGVCVCAERRKWMYIALASCAVPNHSRLPKMQ